MTSAQPFDTVVVHYDAAPPTCQDYGPIFMADTMQVAPAPPPITLTSAVRLPGDAVQFSFAYTPGAACSAYFATDASLPLGSWTFLVAPTEVAAGEFQFTDSQVATASLLYYRVTCP